MISQDALIALAKEEARKRMIMEAYAAYNISGKTVEERVEASAAYRLAQDEWKRAAAAYSYAEQQFASFASANSEIDKSESFTYP